MSMPRAALTALLTVAIPLGAAFAGGKAIMAPKLGQPMSADEVAKWDLTVFPDGRGLPDGRGTAAEGRAIYDAQCKSCHGDNGRGATAEELVGDPSPPTLENPAKAIGPYWPYATTIFDFVRRSMPPHAPGSLSADQVYAVTAYLLAANKIIAETDVIDAKSLPKVAMPNRDGFEWIDATK